MLDSIIDLRVPRFLVLIRNAFGGAYASFNNIRLGADLVVALPTTRLAVMGPAGVEFVYKDEVRAIRKQAAQRLAQGEDKSEVDAWAKAEEGKLAQQYEDEIMNAREALSLGSISEMTMPSDLRSTLTKNVDFYMQHYSPEPMNGTQREFH